MTPSGPLVELMIFPMIAGLKSQRMGTEILVTVHAPSTSFDLVLSGEREKAIRVALTRSLFYLSYRLDKR